MAKYRVTNGSESQEFDDKRWAITCLIQELTAALAGAEVNPVGWHIEEVDEPKDVPDLIPDYEAARKDLHVGAYYTGIEESTDAFEKLLTLCKAWNKADGWEPDRMDLDQRKWAPEFHFMRDGSANIVPEWQAACSSPFVFKTEDRARQFGEKFVDLFKQLYGIKEGE